MNINYGRKDQWNRKESTFGVNIVNNMTNGIQLNLYDKRQDCIDCSRTHNNNYDYCNSTNYNTNIENGDTIEDNLIVYSGFCKTKSNLMEMQNNGINHVIVYNPREINMLNQINIQYIVKIKTNSNDIGIHINSLVNILECNLNNLIGIYIEISKSSVADHVYYETGTKVDEYNNIMYQKMSSMIVDTLQQILPKAPNFRLIKIDIISYNDTLDNDNESNIMFKYSIYNYVHNKLKYNNVYVL